MATPEFTTDSMIANQTFSVVSYTMSHYHRNRVQLNHIQDEQPTLCDCPLSYTVRQLYGVPSGIHLQDICLIWRVMCCVCLYNRLFEIIFLNDIRMNLCLSLLWPLANQPLHLWLRGRRGVVWEQDGGWKNWVREHRGTRQFWIGSFQILSESLPLGI